MINNLKILTTSLMIVLTIGTTQSVHAMEERGGIPENFFAFFSSLFQEKTVSIQPDVPKKPTFEILPKDIQKLIIEKAVEDACYLNGHSGIPGTVCKYWYNFITAEKQHNLLPYRLSCNLEEFALLKIFLEGKLICKRLGEETVELQGIADLTNPLRGAFDLSKFEGLDKHLSISTGFWYGHDPINKRKVEVWIAPRFWVKRLLKNGGVVPCKEIFEPSYIKREGWCQKIITDLRKKIKTYSVCEYSEINKGQKDAILRILDQAHQVFEDLFNMHHYRPYYLGKKPYDGTLNLNTLMSDLTYKLSTVVGVNISISDVSLDLEAYMSDLTNKISTVVGVNNLLCVGGNPLKMYKSKQDWPKTAPVGIFWTCGEVNDNNNGEECFDYLTCFGFDRLSSDDLNSHIYSASIDFKPFSSMQYHKNEMAGNFLMDHKISFRKSDGFYEELIKSGGRTYAFSLPSSHKNRV